MSAPKGKKGGAGKGGSVPLGAMFLTDYGIEATRRALEFDARNRESGGPGHLPTALRAELERYLANPLRAQVEDAQHFLNQRAPYRQGGRPGRVNKKTEAVHAHIRELRVKYLKLSPEQLHDKADRQIIGEMAKKTFANHVRVVDAQNSFPV